MDAADTKKWVGITEGFQMLGCTRVEFERLVRDRQIGVTGKGDGPRSRRFRVADIQALKDRRAEPREELFAEDGRIRLRGHVADWINHRLVERADACWMFLTAYGYATRDESNAIRVRIVSDVDRSGLSRKFFCCDAPSTEDSP